MLAEKQSAGGEATGKAQRFSKHWRTSGSYGPPPHSVVGKYELPNGWCCISVIAATPSAFARSEIGPATAERHGGQPASVRKTTGTLGAPTMARTAASIGQMREGGAMDGADGRTEWGAAAVP